MASHPSPPQTLTSGKNSPTTVANPDPPLPQHPPCRHLVDVLTAMAVPVELFNHDSLSNPRAPLSTARVSTPPSLPLGHRRRPLSSTLPSLTWLIGERRSYLLPLFPVSQILGFVFFFLANVEYCCFDGGLAWATDGESLEKTFSLFGEIIDSKVRLS